MENRSSKIMAIAALLVGIVGLSIGFAAFANTLTINTTANVTPDNRLDVQFTGAFNCTTTYGSSSATVTANGKNLNVTAAMKNPGDVVTCTGTITNSNNLDAYLNSVTGIADGTVAPNGTGVESPSVMPAASDITMTVKVGDDTFSKTVSGTGGHSHMLAKNTSETVVVTITYGGSTYADGKFKVTFPAVSLNYSTVDNH